jgi:hypothetical protein
VLGEDTVTEERFEHRALGLLELQEERILVVPAEQQEDVVLRADAADADDLPGGVRVFLAF